MPLPKDGKMRGMRATGPRDSHHRLPGGTPYYVTFLSLCLSYILGAPGSQLRQRLTAIHSA